MGLLSVVVVQGENWFISLLKLVDQILVTMLKLVELIKKAVRDN